jgi:phosphoglucomutase
VGFKWFVEGLGTGAFGFAGEESAGASFLKQDGTVWTTDKDGVVMGLLAAEIFAKTGRDPSQLFTGLTAEFGTPCYQRIDVAATPQQKNALKALGPDQLELKQLAGDPVTAIRTKAPGNDQPFGGIKVETGQGWFAARPSGTEAVYKLYAESFLGVEHLRKIQAEAQQLLAAAFATVTPPVTRRDAYRRDDASSRG